MPLIPFLESLGTLLLYSLFGIPRDPITPFLESLEALTSPQDPSHSFFLECSSRLTHVLYNVNACCKPMKAAEWIPATSWILDPPKKEHS